MAAKKKPIRADIEKALMSTANYIQSTLPPNMVFSLSFFEFGEPITWASNAKRESLPTMYRRLARLIDEKIKSEKTPPKAKA
jgi:hypothetical protein